jgi:hypothetical protein
VQPPDPWVLWVVFSRIQTVFSLKELAVIKERLFEDKNEERID